MTNTVKILMLVLAAATALFVLVLAARAPTVPEAYDPFDDDARFLAMVEAVTLAPAPPGAIAYARHVCDTLKSPQTHLDLLREAVADPSIDGSLIGPAVQVYCPSKYRFVD